MMDLIQWGCISLLGLAVLFLSAQVEAMRKRVVDLEGSDHAEP